ncbi:activator of HSP90 ATPase [Fulvivirga sp. RKSG066]|uniref:SRPBCC family protein n=1 Tax=Fulvivirga aurantia TaxID=2529383 RepID=UPI0012BBB954|nr:SRPBCC domain-containing protein [Fulvivirga aurantia]MTI23269.1 activator of HSP90 ATPase [Fulvivirga aurantia]
MNEVQNLDKRTLTLERILDAPLELVWDAWTKAEHIVNWWGPKGMKTVVEQHDFKEGGHWKYIMTMPDGSDFIAEGSYTKINEPKFLETSANFKPMTEGVSLQVHLESVGNKTRFIFKVIHPTEAYCKQQEDMGFYNGWNSAFDRLSEFVSSK